MKSSVLIKLIILLTATLLLTACVVQSTHPFYTQSYLVTSPTSIQGEWFKDKIATPWLITGKKIVSYGKGNVKSILIVRFFKVNGTLYSDSSPGDIDNKKDNIFWAFHVSPNHLLSRVVISKTQLIFEPLDPKKLSSLIKENNLTIPSTRPNSNSSENNVYYAKPEVWVKFLAQYGSTPGLFNSKEAITLTRKKP